MSLLKRIGTGLLPLVLSTQAFADHREYAFYVGGHWQVQNPHGALHNPHVKNGAAKLKGSNPFLRGGFIDVGFHDPIVNRWGPDIEIGHTNGGMYRVYARAPAGYWVYLGEGSGQSYVDLGYLPYATEVRIENVSLMKNIFIDWVSKR